MIENIVLFFIVFGIISSAFFFTLAILLILSRDFREFFIDDWNR